MKPQAFIVDIDGTMALKRKGDKNCRGIHDWDRVGDDIGFKPMLTVYNCISMFYRCIFVTGRSNICREETLDWLLRHNVDTQDLGFYLFMRKHGDKRPDWIVKEEIYWENIYPNYEVIAAFDDRDSLVHMWRNVLGIPCFQVQEGAF